MNSLPLCPHCPPHHNNTLLADRSVSRVINVQCEGRLVIDTSWGAGTVVGVNEGRGHRRLSEPWKRLIRSKLKESIVTVMQLPSPCRSPEPNPAPISKGSCARFGWLWLVRKPTLLNLLPILPSRPTALPAFNGFGLFLEPQFEQRLSPNSRDISSSDATGRKAASGWESQIIVCFFHFLCIIAWTH